MAGSSSLLRRVLFALIAVIVVLGVIEVVSRVAEPVIERRFGEKGLAQSFADDNLWQQSLFLSFGGIHRADAHYLWRMRPNLDRGLFTTNSEGFLGKQEFAQPKPDGVYRILLLGDSSPVGLGLVSRDSAFGELTAALLDDRWRQSGGPRVELVNAAVSGYTTAQGLRFLRGEGDRLDPDLIVCYFGNNDASVSGYLSDAELFAARGWTVGLRAGMERFATYRLLRAALTPLRSKQPDESGERRLKLRVSHVDFAQNIRAINTEAARLSVPVVWIVPPVSLTWPAAAQFKVFRTSVGGDIDYSMAEITQQELGRPWWYIVPHQTDSADDEFTRIVHESLARPPENVDSVLAAIREMDEEPWLSDDPLVANNAAVAYWTADSVMRAREILDQAWDHRYGRRDFCGTGRMLQPGYVPPGHVTCAMFAYNLGMISRVQGDSVAAHKWLRTARDSDFHSLRIKLAWLTELYGSTHRSSEVDVHALNAPALFDAAGGEALFIDHCHPTVAGHRLIAEELTNLIDVLANRRGHP